MSHACRDAIWAASSSGVIPQVNVYGGAVPLEEAVTGPETVVGPAAISAAATRTPAIPKILSTRLSLWNRWAINASFENGSLEEMTAGKPSGGWNQESGPGLGKERHWEWERGAAGRTGEICFAGSAPKLY